ncbi:MAG: hypothetical protein IIC28_12555 [Chloroflexi bacterium]|nr:hypothetical protein [Chloroflexota bacterium]
MNDSAAGKRLDLSGLAASAPGVRRESSVYYSVIVDSRAQYTAIRWYDAGI